MRLSPPAIVARGKRALSALGLSATTKADKERVLHAEAAFVALDKQCAETLAAIGHAMEEPGQTLGGLVEAIGAALDAHQAMAAKAKEMGA
jgi:hypothetical protein